MHLRVLARVTADVELDIAPPATIAAALDALEERYPMLKGTIRDHVTRKRRPFVRFFVCEADWSNGCMDKPLPDAVVAGAEPLHIVGAMAGGAGRGGARETR